jgi:hypothetical protein
MDPFTLFALANGAVAAVKKGCQLYKDIKGAAGDVKAVLKDLDDQFNKAHPPDKPASAAAKKQLVEEKTRVTELNKKSEDATNIYAEIGDYLGQYYDNYFKCLAVLEEEEKRSKTEVYSGGDSLAKRALKRVLMRKQLEQMGTELRELMIYQSPPELGALFTDVEALTKEMGKEQKVLIAKQMEQDAIKARRKAARMETYKLEFGAAIGFVVLCIVMGILWSWINHDSKQRHPDIWNRTYQTELEKQKRYEAEKIKKAIQYLDEQANESNRKLITNEE